jgi:hypothetical protein
MKLLFVIGVLILIAQNTICVENENLSKGMYEKDHLFIFFLN